MSNEELLKMYEAIKADPGELVRAAARKRLINFARYMQPDLVLEPFHVVYYTLLDIFAHGKIRKMIVQQPPQHGKALPVDTPVLTTKGWKKHGDLQPGDYVFGDDGKPKKVLANFGKYEWNTQKVIFAGGNELVAAKEHVWKIYADRDNHQGRKEEYTETQNLLRGRHRRSPFIKADVVIEMPTTILPIDPYILGLWLGDGLSAQGVIISGKEDKEHYKSIGEVRKVRPGYYRCLVKGLSRELRVNGLLNNKHIPIKYLLADKEQRYELLRGLMDTNGTVDVKGRCEFCQMEGRLATDVYVLLRSLGFKPTLHKYDAILNGEKVGRKVRIMFTPNRDQKIFKLERKQNRILTKKQQDRSDKNKFFIKNVVTNNNEIVNCIQVDGGMYLAGLDLMPTHNSEGSSRKLPAFMLGLNPDRKICIGSYAATIARDFNRDVQRIIDTPRYRELFPGTYLNGSNVVTMSNTYLRNSDVIEMVGRKGSLRVVGRGGSLTSKTVDVSILDDVYKDYAEGNSPIVRAAAWKWYTTVVRTRLHNDSQELIVFTRWHDDDLIGRIEKSGETIIDVKCWADLENVTPGVWVRINFEGLKTGEPTEIDPRPVGAALWEGRHSRMKLEAQKALDPVQFQCLYQGNPGSAEGRLYQPFKTWVEKSDYGTYIRSGAYIDVADEGDDLLFAATYDVYKSDNLFFNEKTKRMEPILFALITDMEMTDENTDVTTVTVPAMINRNGTQKAWVESNNGGAGYEKVIKKKVRAITDPFYQGGNKESRIITASAMVNQHIIMPFGWETRYKAVYDHVTGFLRNFGANTHDDPEDGLTGIYEKEIADGNIQPYAHANRGVRRRN